jgi:cytochrome c peroxidase
MGHARTAAAIAAILCLSIAAVAAVWAAGDNTSVAAPPASAQVAAYNPYPPGILPPDLEAEIARVQREMRSLFSAALAEWRQLPSPKVRDNPPALQGSGYEALEVLGKLLNFDLNMSPLRNMGCGSCHMPYVAFSGPIPSVNLTMVAYPGTYHYRANKRTAQRYTYSPDFPVLEYLTTQGAFFGGNFWDSRATGYLLRSPDAEQAQFPPVDALEMGNPDTACITYKLSLAGYRPLFEAVWGKGSFAINFPPDAARYALHRIAAAALRPLRSVLLTAPAQIKFTITGLSR